MGKQEIRYYEFGQFRIDLRKRLLLRRGEPVRLTLKVFQLLVALVERSGEVLDKADLMERVWPDTVVEEANLKNGISTLRKALGEERGVENYIQTLPKRGYRFTAPVIALPDQDEVYLVEKQTTAEIVVDEIEVECQTITGKGLLPVETPPQNVLVADSKRLSPEPAGEPLLLIPAQSASDRQPHTRSFMGRLSRNQKAAALVVLLMAALAVAIGLNRWSSAGQTTAAYAFDKMKMVRLNNPGHTVVCSSPDGKYLAYLARKEETQSLWIKQSATESTIQLVPQVRGYFTASFTPDGNYVYYACPDEASPEGALYKVPALGGTPQKLAENVFAVAQFSPEGRRMVFARTDKDSDRLALIMANVDGTDQQVVAPANSRYRLVAYLWSPDETHLTLLVKNDTVEGKNTWQLLEISAAGGSERALIAPRQQAILGMSWFPDGRSLVMTAIDEATGLRQLWQVLYPSGLVRRITNDSSDYTYAIVTANGEAILASMVTVVNNISVADAGDPAQARKIMSAGGGYDDIQWLADNRLLYSASESGDLGKRDLWISSSDGRQRQRLTAEAGFNRYPSMSPDGRYLVFYSNRGGSRQVWRAEADGRNPTQLTDRVEGCSFTRISPDGRWIFYTTPTSSGASLWKLPIAGGESVLVTDRLIGSYALSPDGTQLAYDIYNEQKQRTAVAVRPIDASAPLALYDFPDLPIEEIVQWTPSGLLCLGPLSTEIVLWPLDGSRPRPLTRFNTGERIFSCALSADGKRLAMIRGVSIGDTALITNFKDQRR